jgi:hypothetical protein
MSTTLDNVLKPRLALFAKDLLAAGFKVYLYTSDIKRVRDGGLPQVGNGFRFSREVEGQTCYATVSLGFFESASFSMPIKPSTQNGSSMWVQHRGLRENAGPGDYSEALTVENATLYASPFNSNPLVGRQANYEDTRFPNLYTEVTP